MVPSQVPPQIPEHMKKQMEKARGEQEQRPAGQARREALRMSCMRVGGACAPSRGRSLDIVPPAADPGEHRGGAPGERVVVLLVVVRRRLVWWGQVVVVVVMACVAGEVSERERGA